MAACPLPAAPRFDCNLGATLGSTCRFEDDDLERDTEGVKVVVRVRPLQQHEAADPSGAPLGVTILEQGVHCEDTLSGSRVSRTFQFDAVLPPEPDPAQSQGSVYAHVDPLVHSFLSGCNATVLAYGQTGAGKTYTMGNTAELHSGPCAGVVPRTLDAVFAGCDSDCAVHVSFLEVYNERIRDLLSPGGADPPLAIREANGAIHVAGVVPSRVHNAQDALELLAHGDALRATAATQMNEHSSRSHSIFTLHLQRVVGADEVVVSKFHLVDLAGSERNKRTGNTGSRFRESVGINSGLLALGNVISALSRKPVQHVPYRHSRLTRLLQDSLGGTCRTLFIACISPARLDVDETLNTLAYASRATGITNTPQINRGKLEELQRVQTAMLFGHPRPQSAASAKDADEAAQLRVELQRVREELSEAQARPGCAEDGEAGRLRAEVEQLRAELGEAQAQLRADEGIFADRLNKMKRLKKRAVEAEQECDELRRRIDDDASAKRIAALEAELEEQRRVIEELRSRDVGGKASQIQPPEEVARPMSAALLPLLSEQASPDSVAASASGVVADRGSSNPCSLGECDWLTSNAAGFAAATEDAFDNVLPHCMPSPSRRAVELADAAVGTEPDGTVAELQQRNEELAKESYYYKQTNKRLKRKLRELAGQQQQQQQEQEQDLSRGSAREAPGASQVPGFSQLQHVQRDVQTLRRLTPDEVAARTRSLLYREQTPPPDGGQPDLRTPDRRGH
eukprot:TRINITY_DN18151_c0_g2_i1.p1 TRINITY_DN18151_c0_g2~~TRINITY_DN18151_c0_g2_i1.p1  ORF type:complete len:761 (+),score=245.18 TRINITY_DN18151_c0_g2_i1:63-2285(+)